MRLKILNIIISLCIASSLLAQSLTIEDCYEKAYDNYPNVKQLDLIELSAKYTLINATHAYFPQLSIKASATYQTQVLEFPFAIPGADLPTFSKDQYQAYIELNQIIWDGGAISAQKKNIIEKTKVSLYQQGVDLYTLRERINDIFFGILLMDGQISQIGTHILDLQTNYQMVENGILNGVANSSDLDIIRVEQLTIGQKKTHLEGIKKAFLQMMSLIIGEQINENTRLVKPIPEGVENNSTLTNLLLSENKRPELKLFDAQTNELESQRKFLMSKNMPQIGLFIKGGYGRPSLNMMSNDFDKYAIGGLRLSWNFGNLYNLKNDKKIIAVNQQRINANKESFIMNTNIASTQQGYEIEKYIKIMKDDDSIIELRERIRKAAEKELENGTITASDLVRVALKEEVAKQEKILHEIELLKAIYELKTLKAHE